MVSRHIPGADVAEPVAKPVPMPGRRTRRAREKRGRRDLPAMRPMAASVTQAEPAPDPVRLAVLAMESLGRASMRASLTGTEVRVAVPDAATAAIFQAAIEETSRSRATDRLIRIVVS